MKLPQLSLTTKIANYFLLLALITVSIVGGVAYFRARGALKQAAFNRLNVAATLKEQEIRRWFEDKQRDFLQTTQMPDVQSNLEILLNSEDGAEKQKAYRLLEGYLARTNQIKPSLREIFILDRSNKIVLSTNKEREGEYEILANITYVESVEVGANFAPIFYVSPISIRANASIKSHAELDEAQELDSGNPVDLGIQYQKLRTLLPNLNILGGCCGTDIRHVEEICKGALSLS